MSQPIAGHGASVRVSLDGQNDRRTLPANGVCSISSISPVKTAFSRMKVFITSSVPAKESSAQLDINFSLAAGLLG